MTGTITGKMKRKDLDDVYDEFSDFSLSSPARKIRRLDVELPPIMEEGPQFPANVEQPSPDEWFVGINNSVEQLTPAITEPMHSLPFNEEKALVLYKPVNTIPPGQLFQSPGSSEISLRINSDLLPAFKNQSLWSGGSHNLVKEEETAATTTMYEKPAVNDRLAVIPWVANQFPGTNEGDTSATSAMMEPMDAEEETAEAMMDEDACIGGQGEESIGMSGLDGLHQWQQHCMTPQPPKPATPVMWSL